MRKTLLFVISLLVFQCSFATTYYWVGGTGTGFSSATAFSNTGLGGDPTGFGVLFTAADEIIFDGTDISSAPGIQTGNISITIPANSFNMGQVKFINNVNVTLSPTSTVNWLISGLAGSHDWVIENNSTVTGTNGIFNITIGPGATALVNGNFNLGTATNAQRITTTDPGSVVFGNGAVFTQNGASPFGTAGTTGGVIFQGGATLVHVRGTNPFQTAAGLVTFQRGSLYKLTGTGITPVVSGRVYANFEYASVSSTTVSGSGGYSIDTLTVSSGIFNVHTTGTNSIKGNVNVTGTGWLQLGASSAATTTFNGTVPQYVNIGATATFTTPGNIVVNKSGGLLEINKPSAHTFAAFTVNANDTLSLPITFSTTTGTINGTFRADDYTNCTAGTLVYGANGTLQLNNSIADYTPSAILFPATNGPYNVLATGVYAVIFDQPRTINGLCRNYSTLRGMNNIIINGTLEMTGYIIGSPVYGPSSILRYNGYQTYPNDEWLANVSVPGTPGYPSQVQLINNAVVPTSIPDPGDRYVAGDITIDATSYLDMWEATGPLRVLGNFSNAGYFKASTMSGGDLVCYKNFTNSGTIYPKNRSVLFPGSSDQTLATGGASLYNISINKPSGNLVLGSDVTLSNALNINSGKVVLGNYNLSTATIPAAGATTFAATTGTGALTIKAVGATPVLFPVGNSLTNYTPMTIANGNGDDFSVRVQNTFDVPVMDPTKVVNLQWTVSKTGAQTGNHVTLSPQWNAGDEGTYVRTNTTYLGHASAGNVWDERPTVSLPTGSNPYTTTINNVPSFSPFGIGNRNGFGSALLAVDFVSASAARVGCNIHVKWTAANEINTNHYEIEAGTDGRNFTKVATVAAQGSGNYNTSFAITDALRSAVLFTRIKHIDQNGSYKYSNILTSEGNCNAESLFVLSAYPNPVQAANTITVTPRNGSFNGSYSFTIIDASGKICGQQLAQLNGAAAYALPLDRKLAAGKYIIQVQKEGSSERATVSFEKL